MRPSVAPPYQFELALCGGVTAAFPRIDARRCAGIRRCESPLETMLATAFGNLPGFQWRLPFSDELEVGRWPRSGILLHAQVPCGPYWADFCLRGWDRGANDPLIVIEVDGHDFHERTPAQAQRDRRRDRYLTTHGAAVLRFTGREVWQDARRCAWEVWGFAGRCLRMAQLQQAPIR